MYKYTHVICLHTYDMVYTNLLFLYIRIHENFNLMKINLFGCCTVVEFDKCIVQCLTYFHYHTLYEFFKCKNLTKSMSASEISVHESISVRNSNFV